MSVVCAEGPQNLLISDHDIRANPALDDTFRWDTWAHAIGSPIRHIREARALVIATPETIQVRKMVETARTLNPDISVVVRSHNAEEAARLEKDGSGTVFVGETELAKSMVGHVLGLVVPGVAARH